jgi:hypothetical protein
MDRPRQRTEGTVQQCRPCHDGFASFLGVSFLLLFTGCAQLDQLMGKQAASTEPQPPAQSTDSAPSVATPASGKSPVQAGESAPKLSTKKKPESELKQADQDKALAENDQLRKEKKSHVASDKKSTKKSPKSHAESQPPAEDVFLSPVPLPSKPAAIGGSGG